MLFSVRLSHWTASRSSWSSSAMRRPCHPLRALLVTGSVTPGLTTTLSPIAQLLLPIDSPLVRQAAPVVLVYHRCERDPPATLWVTRDASPVVFPRVSRPNPDTSRPNPD